MTDYLGRLAARTVAPQSVSAARPRIASAYETVGSAAAAVAPAPSASMWDGLSTRPRPQGSRPPDGGRTESSSHVPSPPHVPSPSHVPSQSRIPSEPAPTERVVERVEAPPLPPVIIERIERIEREPPLVIETHEPGTIDHRTTIIERPRRIERLAVRRERERIVERVEAPLPPPAPIEITINRIDVRAAVAAPSEPARSKRPAVMTLEEYVAQRDGERR